ncbi:hypothetical protein ACWDCX_32265 [Streptomyces fungicidicus]
MRGKETFLLRRSVGVVPDGVRGRDGTGLDQAICGGVQVLLDGVEAAGNQLQAVCRSGAGCSRLAGDPVRGVLDESAYRGQRAGLFVGELREDGRELGRRRERRADSRPRRGAGSDRDQVEVLFDATRLLCQAPQLVRGKSVPRAVEVDQVGDQVEAAGLGLDGDPPAAMFLAGDLDAGGPCEPLSDLGPLRSCQFPVIRVKADIEVEDCPPVVVGAGGEWMLQVGVFEVLGPLDGRSDPLLVVQSEVIQAGPVGDDRVLRQALVR